MSLLLLAPPPRVERGLSGSKPDVQSRYTKAVYKGIKFPNIHLLLDFEFFLDDEILYDNLHIELYIYLFLSI